MMSSKFHIMTLRMAFLVGLTTLFLFNAPLVAFADNGKIGLGQSPIDVRGARATTMPPLSFRGHLDVAGRLILENTGLAAMIQVRRKAVLRGGPLLDDYILDRVVFHWGPNDQEGTEHALNGKRYAVEVQLEHYNAKFNSMRAAKFKTDGVAIVSVFLEAGDMTNNALRAVTDQLSRVQSLNQRVSLAPQALGFLGPRLRTDRFLTYRGSLTTAPFFESVTWIIFPRPLHIAPEQVEEFRGIESTNINRRLTDNCRPTEPVAGRDVLYAMPIDYD